jgi:hypothetical protein
LFEEIRPKRKKFDVSGILEMLTVVTCAGFSWAMHREVEQAGRTYTLRESSEAYGGEFVQENEVLTPENTM